MGPEVVQVASVQEAVELAQAFKEEGRYNWFRGQVRDWPPVSTLYRLNRDGDETALERRRTRLHLFTEWLHKIPTLSNLLDDEHVHQFFAIIQHYGIPTNYVDFTTDPAVAGFFAADTKTPPTEGMSCIYCLDTKDLLELAETLESAGVREKNLIETIEVDVTNLWRLQAQRGVFLCSGYNWDIDYAMDRILFPYSGYPSYPPRDYIYPRDRSPLELLLDQYFDVEKMHFGGEEVRKIVEEIQASGVNPGVYGLKTLPSGFYADAFIDPGVVMPLPSWSRSCEPEWQPYPNERYHDVRSHIERISVNAADRLSLERAITFGVKQALDASIENRKKLVEWTLEGATGDLPTNRVSALFRDAWNGMRSLPFSNAQIAAAFSTIVALVFVGFGKELQRAEQRNRFSEAREDGLRVGFGYTDQSSSMGYAVKKDLRNAMRHDFKSLVRPEYHDRIERLTYVLQLVQNPSLLFDFDQLVDIFARDLIPSQIVLDRKPTLFNPAALTIFGHP